jgi:hypothetical protein
MSQLFWILGGLRDWGIEGLGDLGIYEVQEIRGIALLAKGEDAMQGSI